MPNEQEEQDVIREAMRIIGSRTSARKAAAAKENAQKIRTEEVRAKLRQAQQARRERERQEKVSADLTEPSTVPKRPPGRPKKSTTEAPTPKRPRGRPSKQDGQNTTQDTKAPEKGT